MDYDTYIQEARSAYEPMPVELKALIELECRQKKQCGGACADWYQHGRSYGVPMIFPPAWVSALIEIPYTRLIMCPWKGPGFWRVEASSSERYVAHELIVAAFPPDPDAPGGVDRA